jgi:hypothetical protein
VKYFGPSRFRDSMYLVFGVQIFLLLVATIATFDGILLNYYIAMPFAIYFSFLLILAEDGVQISLWKIPLRVWWAISVAIFDFIVYINVPDQALWHSFELYFVIKGMFYVTYFVMQLVKTPYVVSRLGEQKTYWLVALLSNLFTIPLYKMLVDFDSIAHALAYWPILVPILLVIVSKLLIPFYYRNKLLSYKSMTRCLDVFDQFLFLILAFLPIMFSVAYIISKFF